LLFEYSTGGFVKRKVSPKQLDDALQVLYQRSWEDRVRFESWVVGEGVRVGKYPTAIISIAILPISWETLLSAFGDMMASAVDKELISPPRAIDWDPEVEAGPMQ
jgi:hypothetical protein